MPIGEKKKKNHIWKAKKFNEKQIITKALSLPVSISYLDRTYYLEKECLKLKLPQWFPLLISSTRIKLTPGRVC